ncbi:MAG: DNA-directed RNA polymerase subunit alpha C-terminal domain-containing protein, partial [Rubricoccaceae bacterium]|nr:DNA-directed RNA polymerase subunit alpha C-terminal domain-containing protein [Rubricoccaceae bacterium]
LNIELRVGQGRGYVPSEENKRPDDPIGVIAIDSIFTPILNVRYDVTPTRVGQKIDYEQLMVEIETDGSITPEDALTAAAAILRDHIALFVEVETEAQPSEEEQEVDAEVQRLRALFSQSVDDLDLSVRAQNCLRAASIKTIGELVRREESEMLKFRNFGRKSLLELVQVLEERGLRFGMDVSRYIQEPA